RGGFLLEMLQTFSINQTHFMFTDIAPILSVTLMLLTSYNQIHNVWASHHFNGVTDESME
ncbi:hypothetical protein, partial [Hafnia alvei]|uniref:hypothetical protein n=1 Tax=Hafnia alvei TaxID=569 RepID=UPI001E59667D